MGVAFLVASGVSPLELLPPEGQPRVRRAQRWALRVLGTLALGLVGSAIWAVLTR
jgi:hypothetical protein